MKEHDMIFVRTCPQCGKQYAEHPAISRADNKTLICSDCGTREALAGLGISVREQEDILRTIHNCRNNGQ